MNRATSHECAGQALRPALFLTFKSAARKLLRRYEGLRACERAGLKACAAAPLLILLATGCRVEQPRFNSFLPLAPTPKPQATAVTLTNRIDPAWLSAP